MESHKKQVQQGYSVGEAKTIRTSTNLYKFVTYQSFKHSRTLERIVGRIYSFRRARYKWCLQDRINIFLLVCLLRHLHKISALLAMQKTTKSYEFESI